MVSGGHPDSSRSTHRLTFNALSLHAESRLREGLFPFGAFFLNGLGGNALLGTEMIAFIAFLNRAHASGPSIISALGFMLLFYTLAGRSHASWRIKASTAVNISVAIGSLIAPSAGMILSST